MITVLTSSKPEALDTDICYCCMHRQKPLRHDIEAWWQPTPGHGYGQDGRLITLCLECIKTLQFFVELGGSPPVLK